MKFIHIYEEEIWLKEVNKKPKLRTYKRFKTKLRLEKYLLSPGYYKGRSMLTDIRTGTNKLEIEVGRWSRKKEADRLCVKCSSSQV